jgi:hypothetical protein
LRARARERLEHEVADVRVLLHRAHEELDGFRSRVVVPHDARLAVPVDLPHRVVLVHAVVLRLVALLPAHHARLVAEVPVDAPEHRRRLHPDDLLVVEDAEVAPDALDVAAALVRVPAVDRGLVPEHFEHVREHGLKNPSASWMSISR